MKVRVSPDLYDAAAKLVDPGDELTICPEFVVGRWEIEGVPHQGWDKWIERMGEASYENYRLRQGIDGQAG